MKPEPLKRSFMGKTIHPDFIKEDISTYYLEQDIKSAVEWLKREIRILPKDISKRQLEIQLEFIIPKAFEDVIK